MLSKNEVWEESKEPWLMRNLSYNYSNKVNNEI